GSYSNSAHDPRHGPSTRWPRSFCPCRRRYLASAGLLYSRGNRGAAICMVFLSFPASAKIMAVDGIDRQPHRSIRKLPRSGLKPIFVYLWPFSFGSRLSSSADSIADTRAATISPSFSLQSPSRLQPDAFLWPPPPNFSATLATLMSPFERRLTRNSLGPTSRV